MHKKKKTERKRNIICSTFRPRAREYIDRETGTQAVEKRLQDTLPCPLAPLPPGSLEPLASCNTASPWQQPSTPASRPWNTRGSVAPAPSPDAASASAYTSYRSDETSTFAISLCAAGVQRASIPTGYECLRLVLGSLRFASSPWKTESYAL